MFTLNGEPVAVNPESVSSVHPTPPGYAAGTMIDVQNGSEIVKEPFAEVVKKLNENRVAWSRRLSPALRPDPALQFRILLGPAPSLHELRRRRGRFVRPLLCYFGQVRLLHRAHRRLRPPAFPTRSRQRLAGTAMEISRFPGGRLPRIVRVCDDAGRHGPSRLLFDGKHQRTELV